MASKKTKKRFTRRDRRKAKQTRWARAGRNPGGKVGHGGGVSGGQIFISGTKKRSKKQPPKSLNK